MLALLLVGCAAGAGVLRVGINPLSPQYVRGQIISAMEMAGYRKVWFSSFDTAGERVPEIRSAGSDEYRFRREPDASYVARVYFDKAPSRITVRLDERSGAGPREATSASRRRFATCSATSPCTERRRGESAAARSRHRYQGRPHVRRTIVRAGAYVLKM